MMSEFLLDSYAIEAKLLTHVTYHRDEFEQISEGLSDALDFCRTVGANEAGGGFESGGGRGVLGEVDFYTRLVL
jgi:hypothetical protein